MALFNLGKKKGETKASACACSCARATGEATEADNTCCGKAADGICCIKVLGTGCKSCHALYEATKEAVKKLDLPLEVEYITDMEKIIAHGIDEKLLKG